MRRTARSHSSFYVRVGARLWGDRRNLWIFAAGTTGFALAHGALAMCAGLLAQTLLGKQHAHGLESVDPLVVVGLRSASSSVHPSSLELAFLGFAAALVKTAAGAISTYGQKRAA